MAQLELAGANYVVFGEGEEVAPTTGTPHYQGYVQFHKKIRSSTLINRFPGIHFEHTKGTPKANRDYCKKGGKFHEWGKVKPVAHEAGGMATACKFRHIAELAEEGKYGEIKRLYPSEAIRYGRGIMGLRNFINRPKAPNEQ